MANVSCQFFTVFLLVIVSITPCLWSQWRSLWILCLAPSFVAPSSVCEFCCDSSSSIALSFLSCLQVRGLLVFFFLVFRKKVHEQITYRESGITPLVIVVFVIKIMNWSLRSRNLFVKCPWSCSWTDHQIPVYNWWLVIMIWSPLRDQQPKNGHPSWSCPWSDHEHVIRQIWSRRSWSTWWLQTSGKHSRWICLLWINKARAKEKTYMWVSVQWKTKN